MSHDSEEVSDAVKEAGRWVSDSLDEIGSGMWAGSGITELIRAMVRIAEAVERQSGLLERVATAVESASWQAKAMTAALERIAGALEKGKEEQ